MSFKIQCRIKKAKVLLVLDGQPLITKERTEGEYFAESNLRLGNHELRIIEDNILYSKKGLLKLLNPRQFAANMFFMRRYLSLDTFNSEADVLVINFCLTKNESTIDIELKMRHKENNYTKLYDCFEITDCSGMVIEKEFHAKPTKQFIMNYCVVRFLPSLLTFVAFLTVLCRKFEIEFFITVFIYGIYIIANIIFELYKILKSEN